MITGNSSVMAIIVFPIIITSPLLNSLYFTGLEINISRQ